PEGVLRRRRIARRVACQVATGLGISIAGEEGRANQAADTDGFWQVNSNRAFTSRIELPADLHDRVAAVQEKAISYFAFGRVRHRPVEDGEGNGAATVYDVEKSNAISSAEIARPQDYQVGRHLDFPIAVPSRFLEIRDHLISLVGRIDEEIELPGQPLVRAHRSQRSSAGHVPARRDVNARYLRVDEDRCNQEHERQPGSLSKKPNHVSLL